ncbi:MAG: hypothetical protein EBU70_01925 [Actinobacteria bacterium]|nr:hypothetical protein [Actinomycetota bacterium]
MVEIAAIRESTAIRLAPGSLSARVTETVKPGRVTLSVGGADAFVASAGPTAGATWQQDGSSAEWLWVSMAIR